MVRSAGRELQSKIRYKIILPYLVMTIIVALAGSAITVWVAANEYQQKVVNQVAEITRAANDSIVNQEIANLNFLDQITDDTAVTDAIADNDADRLRTALTPFVEAGMNSRRVRLDRIIAFDQEGQFLVDFERTQTISPDTETPTIRSNTEDMILNLSDTPLGSRVLNAQEDELGDKFTGLMSMPITGPDRYSFYFTTVTPVYDNGEVVGGLMLAMHVEQFLTMLADNSQASVIVIYNQAGQALFSTRPINQRPGDEIPLNPEPVSRTVLDVSATRITPEELEELEALHIPEPQLAELSAPAPEAAQATLGEVDVNKRPYQFAFTPLVIRQVSIGYLGAGLPQDYIQQPIYNLRTPIALLTVTFMLAIVGLGMVIARQITSPLEELVAATNDVTGGNLRRRSNVKTDDEIGTLSRSFNRMTEHLLRLYGRVLSESGQRAAIVDSIADGIVVCDPTGNIRVMNRAMRSLLNLHGDADVPTRFSDLPLVPLSHDEGAFGYEQTNLLYTIGDRVVRISDARVTAVDGTYLGEVYVLQDLTAEFNIDRAKTEFIGTISHELRSPMTTLRMTAELLTRGMFGELDERQISAIDTMQYKLVGMTELINNVIIIASIDSGLALEIESVDTREIIEDSVAKLRRGISEKGLSLTLDIPDDLPPVLIDYDHFPTILRQLVENARLYTDEGGITISAARDGEFIRIDVSDTGCGIDPDMTEQVFERFVRGTGAGQGIDSQERGIGLGLAIVKQLVQRHGGQVWVNSTPGEGSVFSFTIRHTDDLEGSHKSGSSLTSAA